MILRRLTEHLKAQNWTAVALEVVIVVTGIFVGLQVSNWNEARQDRARERSYYRQLLLDLEFDQETGRSKRRTTNPVVQKLWERFGEARVSDAHQPFGGSGHVRGVRAA